MGRFDEELVNAGIMLIADDFEPFLGGRANTQSLPMTPAITAFEADPGRDHERTPWLGREELLPRGQQRVDQRALPLIEEGIPDVEDQDDP